MVRQEFEDSMNIIKTLLAGGATVALFQALPAGAQEANDDFVIDEVLVAAER